MRCPVARPKFFVQHFIACLNTAWQGPPGPRTYRDLEGVSDAYFVPPGTEDLVIQQFRVSGSRPITLLFVAAIVSIFAASGVIKSLIEGFQSAYRVLYGVLTIATLLLYRRYFNSGADYAKSVSGLALGTCVPLPVYVARSVTVPAASCVYVT